MKPKVVLKRIFHHDEWRYAIVFAFDQKLTDIVRLIDGSGWSRTNGCWHVACNEKTLKQTITLLNAVADVDISAIAGGNKAFQHLPEISKQVEPLKTRATYPDAEVGPVKNKGASPAPKLAADFRRQDFRKPRKRDERYDPVLFTINEADGRLIIKFTGRYDKEWIKEMRGFGRPYYDSIRNEWLLRWTQLTVDSLSDYFSSGGIEVIVKKKEVPVVISEQRSEQGNLIRSRAISEVAREGLGMVKEYLEVKRYSGRTIESYLANLGLFFKYFHDRDPEKISEDDISHFIEDHIIRLGYSSSYQNLMISAIKVYFSLAGVRHLRLDSLDRPRRARALPKVFSKEEVKRILNASRNNKHKLLLWMIYSCGLRRSEVINIRLTDLDRDRGLVNIREAKGNLDRIVPVSEKVWNKIDEYLAAYNPHKYLFEGQTHGKYSSESVYNVFKQALKHAGIDKEVGVHSLRHSYATHLHESGLDIRYIQELLGHKSSRTTEIYTHISRRNLIAVRSPIEDIDLK